MEKFLRWIITTWEGYYANDPHDHGGETVWGISRKFNPSWEGWKIVDGNRKQLHSQQIKELLLDLAIKYYKQKYMSVWEWLYKTHPKTACFMLDFYINAGYWAVYCLQHVIGAKRDGIIGEETKSKTIQFVDNDLLLRMYKRREQFYYDIAVGEQKKFLAGWLNRNRSVLNQIINSHKLS